MLHVENGSFYLLKSEVLRATTTASGERLE